MAIFLHTRVRVSDLDQSVKWYCDHLGFVVKSRSDRSPAGNQIVHLELPGNVPTLELTYSPDYELNVPEDLMHFAISVPDFGCVLRRVGESGTRNLARWLAGAVHIRGHEDGFHHRSRRLRSRTVRRYR